MSKKSKKVKKPKPRQVAILKASEMEYYINLKYNVNDSKFWKWFFGECPWGETNLLGLHEDDYDIIQPQFKNYFNIIKEDFIADANEDLCLEIENDL
jgi:hypothetical protein